MAITKKRTYAHELPEDKRVSIWNIVTNEVKFMGKRMYNNLMKSALATKKTAMKVYSDWACKNYCIDDFKDGTPREIYHINSGEKVPFMTDELLDEIKKRNPADPNQLDREDEQPAEFWKIHLATKAEIKKILEDNSNKKAPKNKLLEDRLSQMETELKALKAEKGSGRPETPKPQVKTAPQNTNKAKEAPIPNSKEAETSDAGTGRPGAKPTE